MKILIVYQYFGTPNGSWSTRWYEFAQRWIQQGHEVTVISSPYEKSDIQADGFISHQDIDGIKTIVVNVPDSNRLPVWRRGLHSFFFALIATYYTLFRTYNVCISSSGPITVGIPLILAKWCRGKKTVFETRDLWPAGGIEMGLIKNTIAQKLALWFEKRCYRNADLVVSASPGQTAHIQKRFPEISTLVIPNASDNQLFGGELEKDLPDWAVEKPIFTHIGSLGYIHNCRLHLRAAHILQEELNRPDIYLIFIGEGAEREELESYKEQFHLDNVRFLGLLPKNELPVWVQNSHATLFATLNNTIQDTSSPNKVFDSFAAGTPIIQTTQGWIKELVEKENCGINVTPDDPKALAHAMTRLADDESLREEMGQNAKRLAETEFDRGRLAQKYLEALKSLINNNSHKKS